MQRECACPVEKSPDMGFRLWKSADKRFLQDVTL